MPKKKRISSFSREPNSAKSLGSTDQELKSSQKPFRWSLEIADCSGEWGFTAELFKSKWCNGLLKKFLELEKTTWAIIANQTGGPSRGTNSHHVPISDIVNEAKKRLAQLYLDDLDDIYSLRISNKERIYGIVQDTVLFMIWYDPNHQVCPSAKKHT